MLLECGFLREVCATLGRYILHAAFPVSRSADLTIDDLTSQAGSTAELASDVTDEPGSVRQPRPIFRTHGDFPERQAGDLCQVAYLSHLAELPTGKTFASLACFAAARKHATVTATHTGCTVRWHE
jgi:hypothetical protein